MPRGGVRPNSGRKKGSVNKICAEVAEHLKITDREPKTIMAAVMNALYDDALETKNQATLLKAAMIAEKLAPYVHPRLSSITQITEERRVYVASLPDAPQTTQEWADKYEGDTDAVEEEE